MGLAKLHNIDYWLAIEHLPESEEKKLHCHFLLVPAGRVDTAVVRNEIPHCLPLRASKVNDWFLYSLHDPAYLMQHGLIKSRGYELYEMQTNLANPRESIEGLYQASIEGFGGSYNRIQAIKTMASNSVDWSTVLSSGLIPPQQLQFYKELYTQFFRHS